MVQQPAYSIDGDWDGAYYYDVDDGGTPHPFRVRFVTSQSGVLSGGVVDETNKLREAQLIGTYDGVNVHFVKTYVGIKTDPVNYNGVMSPDGWLMSGKWTLEGRLLGLFPMTLTGTWSATRRPVPQP